MIILYIADNYKYKSKIVIQVISSQENYYLIKI